MDRSVHPIQGVFANTSSELCKECVTVWWLSMGGSSAVVTSLQSYGIVRSWHLPSAGTRWAERLLSPINAERCH